MKPLLSHNTYNELFLSFHARLHTFFIYLRLLSTTTVLLFSSL